MGPISCNNFISKQFRPPHFQHNHNQPPPNGPEYFNRRPHHHHHMRQFSSPNNMPLPQFRHAIPNPIPLPSPSSNHQPFPYHHHPPPPPQFGNFGRRSPGNIPPIPFQNNWNPQHGPNYNYHSPSRSRGGPAMFRPKYFGSMKNQKPYSTGNFRRVNSKTSFLSSPVNIQQVSEPSQETMDFHFNCGTNRKKRDEFNHLWSISLSVSPSSEMESFDKSSTESDRSESTESDSVNDAEDEDNVESQSESFIIPLDTSATPKTIGIFHYDAERYLEVYLFVHTISKFNQTLDKWQEVATSGAWFGEKNLLNVGHHVPLSGKETVHSATIQAAGRVLVMAKNRTHYNKVRIYTNSAYLVENIKTWHENRANWANGTTIKETTWAEVKYRKEVNKLCNSLMSMAVQWSLVGCDRYGMKQAIKLSSGSQVQNK